jgi:hypothetical protein
MASIPGCDDGPHTGDLLGPLTATARDQSKFA